ncbi:probable RNA-binding protein 46 [Trichonephila clavata]|uniref:Probable RNA-binding protein 46 n=1 Tax=Trichonephila clavata TaxID=2740835 RepID=A0A8X6KJG6_TRICU|nr:probable RNA-binding protein 46 [Trichonephila clavata]
MFSVLREEQFQALGKEIRYNISLQDGLRKLGPPFKWFGPPPPKESKIFIGKLPRDVYETELFQLCENFGKVYELIFFLDYEGDNLGYAFVTYTNNEDAAKAIQGMDKLQIRLNQYIGACESVDNCSLFIGGFPKEKNKDEIMIEIGQFTKSISGITPCGGTIVRYENRHTASMAKRLLLSDSVKLFDHEIFVDWAKPAVQVQDEIMRKMLKTADKLLHIHSDVMKTLSVFNAPNTSEEQLHVFFSLRGSLEVEVVKKLGIFVFIRYTSREEAETAIQEFDGKIVNGRNLQVTWARPFELLRKETATYNATGHSNNYSLENCSGSNPPSVPTFSGRQNPVELLNHVCAENEWGEPIYKTTFLHSDEFGSIFSSSITIPGLFGRNYKYEKVCRSPEEARSCAASDVLGALNILGFTYCPRHFFNVNPYGNDVPTSPNAGIDNRFLIPVTQQSNLCPNFENSSDNNVLTASDTDNTSNLDVNSQVVTFSNRGQNDTFQERSSLTLIDFDYLMSSVNNIVSVSKQK